MGLKEYRKKRDFTKTAEPAGGGAAARKSKPRLFVIQKHAATRLHYDLRLEHGGVLKSWAVPKGPNFDPSVKALAVEVEDHPIEYGNFEGTIPQGEYGGGNVILWDKGTWEPLGDVDEGLRKGHLAFVVHARKIKGAWTLARMKPRGDWDRGGGGKNNWLLIKRSDEFVRGSSDPLITEEEPYSIKTGRTVEEVSEPGSLKIGRERLKGGTPARTTKKTTRKKTVGQTSRLSAGARRTPRTAKKKAASKKTSTSRKTARKSASRRTTLARAPRNADAESPHWGEPAPITEKSLSAARHAPIPLDATPALAVKVDAPPHGPEWVHELKLDGYRLLAFKQGDRVRLITRGEQDWTARFKPIAEAIKALPWKTAVIDGEVIAADERGRPDFQRLQNVLRDKVDSALHFYIFDLLYFDGLDIRRCPLLERKAVLKDGVSRAPAAALKQLHYNEHVQGDAEPMRDAACRAGLEGIISKLAGAPYLHERTHNWLKSKCWQEQEFVIGGFTPPEGSRAHFGSLLLGFYDKRGGGGKLHYAGKVGTGFDRELLKRIHGMLMQRRIAESPFEAGMRPPGRDNTWVKPELIAQVAFAERTRDAVLRQARFKGLREDKAAREVVWEEPEHVREAEKMAKKETARASSRKSTRVLTVSDIAGRHASADGAKKNRSSRKSSPAPSPRERHRSSAKPSRARGGKSANAAGDLDISNPHRVIDEESGLTKLDAVVFYQQVAEVMMPHAANRPTAVVRCPQGIGEGRQRFFQRHWSQTLPPGVDLVEVPNVSEKEPFVFVADEMGFPAFAQLNAIEFHPWGAANKDLEHPDRLIFDLDPGEGVKWPAVIDAALRMKDKFEEIGLKSFVKLSGGKGVHVFAPIDTSKGGRGRGGPPLDWDAAKALTRALAQSVVEEQPDKFTASIALAKRPGKIFIDYLRNTRAGACVAPMSLRARPGLPVSVPVTWAALKKTGSGSEITLKDAKKNPARFAKPWAAWAETRQRPAAALLKMLAG